MRLFFLTLAVAMFITPAGAEWKVNTYTDPKTNVTMSVATLSSASQQYTLQVTYQRGQKIPEIAFLSEVSFLRINLKYRFDNDAEVSRTALISRDGRVVRPWSRYHAGAIKRLAKAKQLRVQMFPVGTPTISVDFDTTGADAALQQVKCK